MAVYARMFTTARVNADDLAATLLAKELARTSKRPYAVVRNGDDYIVVSDRLRTAVDGKLIDVVYPDEVVV